MAQPFSLSDPDIVPNPYPVYASLADQEPVHWSEGLNAWAVMRYDDCANALRDPRLKAERMEEVLGAKFPNEPLPSDSIYHRFTKNVMMYTDPPRHDALRKSTRPAFTRAAHDYYNEVIRRVAFDLIATAPDAPCEIEAVSALAAKLPVAAAVHAFGVPEEDLAFVMPRVDTLMSFWSGPQDQPIPLQRLLDELDELHTYSRELLLGQRGAVAPGTVIARLAADGAQLRNDPPTETIHQLVLLLIALFAPTTPGSTSSGLLAFATNRSQIARFLQEPALADNLANEVVRYNASNQFTWRVAATDVNLRGVRIREGDNVTLFLGAANRDGRFFRNPDVFDLGRKNSGQHLSFGLGVHSCLGRQIANLELKWFFTALFARFNQVQLAGDPEWNPNLEFRSLRSLPLRFN